MLQTVRSMCIPSFQGETPTETSFQQSQDILTNIPGRRLAQGGDVKQIQALAGVILPEGSK